MSEVLLSEEESEADALALIHSIPADRWFVMVSEEEGNWRDALAMIDDRLEFQICAHGLLSQD